MHDFMILAIIGTVKDTLVFYLSRNLTKSMQCEMQVKGTRSWCHRYRERHLSILHDMKF